MSDEAFRFFEAIILCIAFIILPVVPPFEERSTEVRSDVFRNVPAGCVWSIYVDLLYESRMYGTWSSVSTASRTKVLAQMLVCAAVAVAAVTV